MLLKIGATLFGLGISILAVYGFYIIFSALYSDRNIPVFIRVAGPVVILGLLLVIAALGLDRYRARQLENFEETEY